MADDKPVDAIAPVIFLGICSKVLKYGHSIDLIGLTNIIRFPFLPQSTAGLFMAFSVSADRLLSQPTEPVVIRLRGEPQHDFVGEIKCYCARTEAVDKSDQREEFFRQLGAPVTTGSELRSNLGFFVGSATPRIILPTGMPPAVMMRPSVIRVYLVESERETLIGSFASIVEQTPPISPQEREELTRRPGSMCSAMFKIGCKECSDKIVIYATIDDSFDMSKHSEPGIMIGCAPDEWLCGCKKTCVPLLHMKRGIHEIFRHSHDDGELKELGFTPIYQKVVLDSIISKYHALINGEPSEEEVQLFLEQHEVLWSFVSPTRVIAKPRLLTHNVADFALLMPNKTLMLVEIEKPQSRLLRESDGGRHSDVQRGLDQIDRWRVVLEQDRRSVLSEMGLREEQVHRIEYLLVAGLAHRCAAEKLRVLRNSFGEVQFMTFDEIESRAQELKRQVSKL